MALADPNPVTYTAALGMVSATHKFHFNQSKTMELHIGQSFDSSIFSLAGRTYKILFYPQGTVDRPNSMCVSLTVKSPSAETVSVGYIFLNKAGMPNSKASARTTFTMSSTQDRFGMTRMMDWPHLEAEFVKDGCFTLLFSLTFLGDSHSEAPTEAVNGIIPFSINEQFAGLLGDKEMTDVVFEVGGETITAHRLVLGARSAIFKAQLFGMMAEKDKAIIQIGDIAPPVFKAMLHFIYSDSLPDMSNEETPVVTLIQHLYKAADMYFVEGLKVVCR
ncbi:hypothetical protein LUZ61_011036 [Rhynchospora tenuis]|uniref:BTB domain-containing protein n=1 Tax=Rhynchospora tenuis TaxID=198213 RepID=A0AAD6A083_9POAL|nr:hypothetical protein LUZ61_011036 [Rhynchospora tenuis]